MTGTLDAIGGVSSNDPMGSAYQPLTASLSPAGDLIDGATDPRTGVTDTHALASKVADMYKSDPNGAQDVKNGIEQQLLNTGRISDISHFNQSLAELTNNPSASASNGTGDVASATSVAATASRSRANHTPTAAQRQTPNGKGGTPTQGSQSSNNMDDYTTGSMRYPHGENINTQNLPLPP